MIPHRSLCAALCVALAFGVAATCLAQDESESIYIANTKVITIREKGTYPSVRHRAMAIDKAVTDVISTQDTQNPDVKLKQVGDLWTVFVGDIKIVEVLPAEVAANDLPAQSLGAMWAKNLRQTFPKATPCSKLPASAFQPAPGAATAPQPTATAPQPAPIAAVPGPLPDVPSAATSLRPVSGVPIGAPTLVVRDYFNTVRALPEEEYTSQRDELVKHLIRDLTPFITGKIPSVAGVPASPTPLPEPPSPPSVYPVPAPVAPVGLALAGPSHPTPPVGAAPAASDLPDVVEGDPSYAKVPQKIRIRQKLEKAREPYVALAREDAQAAKPINKLLAACRESLHREAFDDSEGYIDTALKLLGVSFP